MSGSISATVGCCGTEHILRVEGAVLVADAHADPLADDVLQALGGGDPMCGRIVVAWDLCASSSAGVELALAVLAGRTSVPTTADLPWVLEPVQGRLHGRRTDLTAWQRASRAEAEQRWWQAHLLVLPDALLLHLGCLAAARLREATELDTPARAALHAYAHLTADGASGV